MARRVRPEPRSPATRSSTPTTSERMKSRDGRASEHSTGGDDDKMVAGIRITHRHALEVLAKIGVTQMETVGQKFDPRYHEAVDVVASVESGVEPGTIVSEMQRGYFVNGDVLRHAKVR